MTRDNDDAIFKVQTVPPPPGATDAYSAPTKVAPMDASVLDEMIVAAKRNASPHLAETAAYPKLTDDVVSRAPVPTLLPPSMPVPPVSVPAALTPASAPGGWHIALRAAALVALFLVLGILGGAAFLLFRR